MSSNDDDHHNNTLFVDPFLHSDQQQQPPLFHHHESNGVVASRWSPKNIPLLVENAQGLQFTINLMNYIGTNCIYYRNNSENNNNNHLNGDNSSGSSGSGNCEEPKPKEERFGHRLFVVGCQENTRVSRRATLGPIIQQATTRAGFSVSAEKGYRKATSSLTYYCTRYRCKRPRLKTGGKSGKFRHNTKSSIKPTAVEERCNFHFPVYWDEPLQRWFVWASGSGCTCHVSHMPIEHVEQHHTNNKHNKHSSKKNKSPFSSSTNTITTEAATASTEATATVLDDGNNSDDFNIHHDDEDHDDNNNNLQDDDDDNGNNNNDENDDDCLIEVLSNDLELRQMMLAGTGKGGTNHNNNDINNNNNNNSYHALYSDYIDIAKICDLDFDFFQLARERMQSLKQDLLEQVQDKYPDVPSTTTTMTATTTTTISMAEALGITSTTTNINNINNNNTTTTSLSIVETRPEHYKRMKASHAEI